MQQAIQNSDVIEIKEEEVEIKEEEVEVMEEKPVDADGDEPMEQEDEKPSETTSAVEKIDENSQKDQEMDMNIAEMDISEVTVIDEYDSTKCDEQEDNKSSKKKAEPKKMDDKERHMWERRYQLPDHPHVLVHPSKTAKSGKFDCTVVSLSLLLDYRKDDSKEHSFEIALFAEAFNEMLMRDFGFNIYKSFNYFNINTKDNKVKDDDKDKDKKKESTDAVEAIAVDTEKSNDATEHDERKDGKDSKSRIKREDSGDQSDQSRRRDGKDRNAKYITAFPDLLLSFNYFDQTQCGYIFEKDLEELFFSLGLNLSRSQVRKLTEKFITRDSLYYRRLTDRLLDAPAVNPYENVTEEQLAALAHGNTSKSDAGRNSGIVSKSNSDIVMFEGATINLQQVMHQMKRTEAAYEENEKLLIDLKRSNAELKNLNHKNEKRIKDLYSDLKSNSRKLQDAESSLSSVTVSLSFNLIIYDN